MMSFPAGTVFTPYAGVRNVSNQPVTVTPTLWWMQGASANSAQLGAVTLAPHQTQNLEVPSLIARAGLKNFNGSVNLILDTKGQEGALLMASGSVDQKNTYVFEVMPRGVSESVAKNISYWNTGNGNDTMVTLWNPADEDQDLLYTLFFSGGHYAYPIHLAARATRTFNTSEIIHNQIPDAEGNVVPTGVQEGSAKISGSQAENEHILVAMDAGTYNVRKATCGGICTTCDGVVSSSVVADPFNVAFGANTQETFVEQYNTGGQYDVTGSSNWSSSNSSIATVNSGLVSGVSVGSFSVYSFDSVQEPAYQVVCSDVGVDCPFSYVSLSGSAPGNVKPTISGPNTVWYFKGSQPSGWATSITLTSSGGSSTTWTVTAGANKVSLSATSGSQTIITSSGAAFSSAVGDITITATANQQTSAPFSITSRTPNDFQPGAVNTVCDNTYGFVTTINYTIRDQLMTALPARVPANENWLSGVSLDNPSSNWSRSAPNGVNLSSAAIADQISGGKLGTGEFPVPTCGGTAAAVDHWTQEWRVGSATSGVGKRVQCDTLQRYTNSGAHLGIISPCAEP
jgi:hypothetical protein